MGRVTEHDVVAGVAVDRVAAAGAEDDVVAHAARDRVGTPHRSDGWFSGGHGPSREDALRARELA